MTKRLLLAVAMLFIATLGMAQPASPYCNTQVTHFAGDPGSEIFLTIANIDAQSMYVEIESASGNAVDFLLVNGGSGAIISPEDMSVPGKIRRTLTWVGAPPTDVVLNVLCERRLVKISFY